MVLGAPLEDARHLAQRYDRMRQEAEAQVIHLYFKVFHFKINWNEIGMGLEESKGKKLIEMK